MRTDQRGAIVERRPEAPAPFRWEYRSDTLEIGSDLAQYGAEGWELVTVLRLEDEPTMGVHYFKRRIRP